MFEPNQLPDFVTTDEATLAVLTEAWISTTVVLIFDDPIRLNMLIDIFETQADNLRGSDRGYLADIFDGWVERIERTCIALREEIENPGPA